MRCWIGACGSAAFPGSSTAVRPRSVAWLRSRNKSLAGEANAEKMGGQGRPAMEARKPEDQFIDDRGVEIVDLPGYERVKAGKPRFQDTRRRLFQSAGILILVLFCLVLLLDSATGLRSFVLTNILGVNPAPTSMIGPNIDLFYVNATPPWGVLSIDGNRQARPPDPAAGLPLRLGRGSHHLTWRAAPFPIQSCV